MAPVFWGVVNGVVCLLKKQGVFPKGPSTLPKFWGFGVVLGG